MAKTVAADEFQAHPLELLEEATEKQEEVIVLKNGKPIGRLTPIETTTHPKTIEELRALGGRILGDIVEPLDEWDMTK
jgi:prevent-host-death family protein